MKLKACTCNGGNENCCRCGGSGYIPETVAQSRYRPLALPSVPHPAHSEAHTSSGNPTTQGKRMQLASPPARGLLICPGCGVKVKKLNKHRRKCPVLKTAQSVSPSAASADPAIMQRPVEPTSSELTTIVQDVVTPEVTLKTKPGSCSDHAPWMCPHCYEVLGHSQEREAAYKLYLLHFEEMHRLSSNLMPLKWVEHTRSVQTSEPKTHSAEVIQLEQTSQTMHLTTPLQHCPKCHASVRADRLAQHLLKVHSVGPKPAAPDTPRHIIVVRLPR